MTHSFWRGHPIVLVAASWVYADNGELVSADPQRVCGHCGESNTVDGHDGCLGTLPGVMNACCGHGVEGQAYVQYPDGRIVSGPDAVLIQQQSEGSSV